MTASQRRRDGRSRQFGFVGYTSVAEAQDAIKYFNKSFIGTFRLVVEVCTRAHAQLLGAMLLVPSSAHAGLCALVNNISPGICDFYTLNTSVPLRPWPLAFQGLQILYPQPAYQHGAGAAPRPWSKYSEGTSAHERVQPKEVAPAKKSVREEEKKRKLKHGGDPAGAYSQHFATISPTCCVCPAPDCL